MVLPGLDRGNLERIREVIAYKRRLRLALPKLQLEVAKLSNFPHPEIYAARAPSDAPFAYLHAVELALAIDDVELAIEILREFFISDGLRPRTLMQLCWFALAGAIAGILVVELRPSSFSFGRSADEQDHDGENTVPWPIESIRAVEVARHLLPASVATIPFEDAVVGFEEVSEGSFGKAAWRSLQLTSEYQAISELWSHSAKDDSVNPGLSELEERFAHRTRRTLARLNFHPSAPRGVVDFALLSIYVGLVRQNKSELLIRRDDMPEIVFLREIAKKIASITPPFGGRRGKFLFHK